MISVVNCGVGNCGSVVKMLSLFSNDVSIADHPDQLKSATKLVLPGVGSYDNAMTLLQKNGFIDVLNHLVLQERIPILGICLGMQLLCNSSEEGKKEGIGWLPLEVKKFDFSTVPECKTPHMGWNTVNFDRECPLAEGLPKNPKFYFAHSYCIDATNGMSAGKTHHGHTFSSVVMKNNIFGVQFHPEKSHQFGLQLMKNFVRL